MKDRTFLISIENFFLYKPIKSISEELFLTNVLKLKTDLKEKHNKNRDRFQYETY